MKRLVVVLTVWVVGSAWVVTSALLPAGFASDAMQAAVAVAVTNTATPLAVLPSMSINTTRPHAAGGQSYSLPLTGTIGKAQAILAPTVGTGVKVSTGGSETCAVTTVGGIKCWGENDFGQLGDGHMSPSSSVPVDVLGLGSGAVAVSTGTINSCALTDAGAVKCWGYNAYGQLGDGATTHSSVPVNVVGLESGVVAVSVGRMHSCAVTSAGAVKCWGWNMYGQLGDGTTTNSSIPVSVIGLESGVVAVSAGADQTCALTAVGAATCWGKNTYGELGAGTTTNTSVPVSVIGLESGVVAIDAGYAHSCALMTAGALRCWGLNIHGQLGNGTTTNSSVPVDVVGLGSEVSAVSAGTATCALTMAGEVKCWGPNAQGELGDGTTTDSAFPVGVVGLGSAALAVVQGGIATCAVTSVGAVKCWGYNAFGGLGDGSTTDSPVPVDVVGLGVPATPTGVSGTAGNAQAVVSWNVSANDGGSVITHYTVTAAPGGKTFATSGSTTATVAGLTNGTAYTFTVTATNAAGTSPASLASAGVTPKARPGPPTGALAIAGKAQAVVSWAAPSTNGGSAITGYTVTAAPGGRTATTTGSTTATVTGLTNGVAYTFTVTANNEIGTGAPSAPSAAVTPRTQIQNYVVRVYSDLFNRAPDPAGLATWTDQLQTGTPRVAVANAITSSAEYRSKLITRSYDHYLGRTPDARGLQGWVAAMGRGMTIARMESGFIASREYYTKSGSTNAGWVNKLYQDVLGRTAAPSEVTGWTSHLIRGVTRDKVAMGFLLSTEHLTTVVNGYYKDLLGRSIDPTGQRTWVGSLQRGERDEKIIGGIIAGTEYFAKS